MPFESVVHPILRRPLLSGRALVLFYILFEGGARPILGWPFCSKGVLVLF